MSEQERPAPTVEEFAAHLALYRAQIRLDAPGFTPERVATEPREWPMFHEHTHGPDDDHALVAGEVLYACPRCLQTRLFLYAAKPG